MQVSHNNLEMTHNEDRLRFTNRGILSRTYTDDGEEFGLFFETSFGKSFIFKPTLAITSGDGRNSFGDDSRDSDKGGIKFGSRINILPFGDFSIGNRLSTVDLMHEEKPKVQIGVAYSKNIGASFPGLPFPTFILSTLITGVTNVVALVIKASFACFTSLSLKLSSLNFILFFMSPLSKVFRVTPLNIFVLSEAVLSTLFLSNNHALLELPSVIYHASSINHASVAPELCAVCLAKTGASKFRDLISHLPQRISFVVITLMPSFMGF